LKGAITTRDGSIIPGDIITAIEGKPEDRLAAVHQGSVLPANLKPRPSYFGLVSFDFGPFILDCPIYRLDLFLLVDLPSAMARGSAGHASTRGQVSFQLLSVRSKTV
jgi:hypothetical protein